MLELQPITYIEAKKFVEKFHRHNPSPIGWKFGIAVNNGKEVVGVIMVGRPISRHFDDGWTMEVLRCCTDGTKNAASKLYGAARRATFALGYKRLVTYTLEHEKGISLVAAGYKRLGEAGGGSWNTKSRPRVDKHILEKKVLWEAWK